MLIRYSFSALLLPLLLCRYVYSQDSGSSLSFDLSARYRFELFDGFNARNYGDDSRDATGRLDDKVLLQKIITGITYRKGGFTASVHLQDSRAFGWSLGHNEYPGLFRNPIGTGNDHYYTMNPQEEFFEIYDLFVEYRDLLKNLSVKIGRQKIFFGDYRMVEPGLWGNTGRWTWDAIKISYRKNDEFIDIFGGGTKIHDPLRISLPFTLTEFWGGGFYAHKTLTSWIEAEPFFILKREGSADYIRTLNINRNWIGLRILSPENQQLIYDLLFTREFGREAGKKISAYGYSLKTGYRFDNLPASPEFSISYNYASGERKGDDIIQAFDPAYGARARLYGWMGIITWTNLSNPQVSLKLKPDKNRMLVEVKYYVYLIPEPDDFLILNTMKIKKGSNHLGNETDLFLRYQYNNRWQFTGVLGHFKPGDLEQINFRDPEPAFWMGLQVQFTLN